MPRPSLAAFAPVTLRTLLYSATPDLKSSPEKASAAATSAREHAAARQPVPALDTIAPQLREPAGKLHLSRTVPDIALDLSGCSDQKLWFAQRCRPERSCRCLLLL